MSLTSFVKTPEILDHILAEWPVPHFDLEAPLLAPPLSTNYRLVGTAFDYLLRFYLRRLYPQAVEKRWVAEYATNLPRLEAKIAKHKSRIGTHQTEEEKSALVAMTFEKACLIVETAKKEHSKFLSTGELTDDLLRSVIRLARLDAIYRAGYVDPDLEAADLKDIADLRRLYEIIPPRLFSGRTTVLLNPVFPGGSSLVGGADCDIVLDTDILDFKTIKYLELRKEDWAQLIGYSVLADIAHETDARFPRFRTGGIYFCRHGVAWAYPIEELYKHPRYPAFRGWFIKEARKMFPQSPSLEKKAQKILSEFKTEPKRKVRRLKRR